MKKLGANYWRLWSASVVSNFGDGISTVAYPWLASAVTRNPIPIALIGVLTRLPWLLFSLPAGVITDRVDRRKLIAAMDVARFGITLTVAVVVTSAGADLATPAALSSGAAEPSESAFLLGVLYVAALAFGIAEVLRDNAAQTLMPSIVAKEHLEKANGNLWGAETVMNAFVGPPLAGVLLAIGFAVPFFVDAGTFLVSAVLIASITGSFQVAKPSTKRRFRDDIADGVRWLWNHKLLRAMAIILGVYNAVASLALATYVLYVQEVLGLEPTAFGLLLTGGAVGGVIGSVTASRISQRLGSGTSLFVSIVGGALTFLVPALVPNAVAVWASFAMFSLLAVLWNVITVSLRQTIIPDHLLGRVNSVYRLFAWGMMPAGTLIGGVVVAVAEPAAGRDLALRMPFLVAAVILGITFLVARPHLTTDRLEAARAAAESTPESQTSE